MSGPWGSHGCSIEEEKGEGSLSLFGACPLTSPLFDLLSYWLPLGWNPDRPPQWPLLSRAVLKAGVLAWPSCQSQSDETTWNSRLSPNRPLVDLLQPLSPDSRVGGGAGSRLGHQRAMSLGRQQETHN